MFTELKIKNFQSLSDCTIQLGKITVIIGPSFLGKSAVVRALYSLARNRFSSSYMKKGTSSTVVELHEGEKWVKYIRGNSSSYRYSENPEDFTKIGREVPKEIKEFLNMDEIIFDKDLSLDFNFQRQFDSPFIIGLSGFEAAKVFGKLMNLDIVLAATREISKDIRSYTKELDKNQAIIDVSVEYIQKNFAVQLKYSLLHEAIQIQEELDKEAEWNFMLEQLLADIELCERQQKSLEELVIQLEEAHIDSLELFPSELEDLLVRSISNANRLQHFESLVTMLQVAPFDIEGYISLEKFLVDSDHLNAIFAEYAVWTKEVKKIDFNQAEALEQLGNLVEDGDSVNASFIEAKKEAANIRVARETLDKEFEEFIAANNICPISQQPYTQACIEAIRRG